MGMERRKHPRRSLALQVRWKQVDPGVPPGGCEVVGAAMESAVTVDFSDGGIAFVVPGALPVGAALAIELERETGGPPLSALGRVARCAAGPAGWLVGVELTWVESATPSLALGVTPESAWTLL